MTTNKNRTVPQLPLSDLSGNCTVCVFDDITLSAIIRIWAVTLYPSTWIDPFYNKTILELRNEYGLASSATVSAIARRQAILDDFERGIKMGCDIASILEVGFSNLDSRLSALQSALSSAIRQSACCDNLTAGVIDPQSPIPDVTDLDNPELCKRVRYAQWLCETWLGRFYPLTLGFAIAEIVSIAVPPYSTTAAEIVALIATITNGGAIEDFIAPHIPDIFDAIYCRLRENSTGSSALDWLSSAVMSVVESEQVATVISWAIGASGALNSIIGIDILSVPPGFEYEGCHCSVVGNYEYVSSTPGGEYQPSYSVGNCDTDGRYTGVGGNAVVTFNLFGWSIGSTIVTVSYALYSTLNTASVEIVVDGQTIVTDTGNTCNGVITAGLPPTYETVQVIFRENNAGSGVDVAILDVEWSE